MSPVAPIAAVRTIGIRPVVAAPVEDPSEEGLDIEAVTEVTYAQPAELISPTEGSESIDAGADRGTNAFTRAATVTPIATIGTLGDVQHLGEPRGNSRVSTGFDRTPAQPNAADHRQSFASPFARAMASAGS